MSECYYSGCGHEGKIDGLCAKHHAMKEKTIEKADKEPACSKCGKKASEVKTFIKKRGMCSNCAYYEKEKSSKKGKERQHLKPAPHKEDIINHPAHCTKGKIEVIDFIADHELGFLDGNIIQYVAGYRHKETPLEDLEMARRYLDKLIEKLEGQDK